MKESIRRNHLPKLNNNELTILDSIFKYTCIVHDLRFIFNDNYKKECRYQKERNTREYNKFKSVNKAIQTYINGNLAKNINFLNSKKGISMLIEENLGYLKADLNS